MPQVMWPVVTKVQSASAHGAPWWVLLQNYYVAVLSIAQYLMLWMLYFSSSRVLLCTFSARCVYSMFGHHPHSLGYLCTKLRFFHDLHCWATQLAHRKYDILNQTITHSVTQLIWCPGNWSACTLEKYEASNT